MWGTGSRQQQVQASFSPPPEPPSPPRPSPPLPPSPHPPPPRLSVQARKLPAFFSPPLESSSPPRPSPPLPWPQPPQPARLSPHFLGSHFPDQSPRPRFSRAPSHSPPLLFSLHLLALFQLVPILFSPHFLFLPHFPPMSLSWNWRRRWMSQSWSLSWNWKRRWILQVAQNFAVSSSEKMRIQLSAIQLHIGGSFSPQILHFLCANFQNSQSWEIVSRIHHWTSSFPILRELYQQLGGGFCGEILSQGGLSSTLPRC